MKITSVDVLQVRVPLDAPYGAAREVLAAVACLKTDLGLEGVGSVMPLYGRQFKSLVAAVQELAETIVGEDATRPEWVHRKMMTDGSGTGGVGNLATAALDIGVWDLAAKAAGLPLYRMLGGYRDRVPAYASLRLGRDLPSEELPGVARSLVQQGFTAMKMNLAGPAGDREDLLRARSVRDAIGADVNLLVDVNFRWSPSQAIRMGHALEELGLFWLEDPVPTSNLAGLAEVRRAIRTPIAAAEALFGLAAFHPLFEARALDYPMPDLARVGGITPFLKVAHMADGFGLPVACHLQPEVSVQVLAAVPNGVIAEYVPWAWKLYKGAPVLERGQLVMSERPGHGMELDQDFVKEHRIA